MSAPLTTARVWALAWPIILSGLSVPLLGAVDTAVMGHLPDPGWLGAVAIGALVFDFVYWGFGFLRMGTTGFTAHARGRQDPVEVRRALARPLLLAAALGAVILALQGPIEAVAFTLVDAGEALSPRARGYFQVRIWAAPAVLANYVILGWLLGVQRPRAALVVQVVTNAVNVGLDLWFVQRLGWAADGVAAATAIAQGVGLVVGGLQVRRVLRGEPAPWGGARTNASRVSSPGCRIESERGCSVRGRWFRQWTRLVPRHHRHPDIHQNQIGKNLSHLFERLSSIFGEIHFVMSVL